MAKYSAFAKYRIPWRLKPSRDIKILESRCLELSAELKKQGPWKDLAAQSDKVRQVRAFWLPGATAQEKKQELLRQQMHLRLYPWVKRKKRLLLSDMSQLHGLSQGLEGGSPFRSEDVVIRTRGGRVLHRYPPPVAIPALLHDLSQWESDRAGSPSLANACTLHLLILCVHPFMDGNGRVARAFEFVRMQQLGLRFYHGWEPELVANWNLGGYSRVIQSCRRNEAANEFVMFMLNGYLGLGQAHLL